MVLKMYYDINEILNHVCAQLLGDSQAFYDYDKVNCFIIVTYFAKSPCYYILQHNAGSFLLFPGRHNEDVIFLFNKVCHIIGCTWFLT